MKFSGFLANYTGLQIQARQLDNFLNGQLTIDVTKIKPKELAYAAYCNQKGRVVATCWIAKAEQSFLIFVESSNVAAMRQQLEKYGKFSKIKITKLTKPFMVQDDAADCDYSYTFEEQTLFGVKLNTHASNDVSSEFHHLIIRQSHPTIGAATSGQFLPHHLGLDQIGALNFTKGCYLGQEVIARMHYKSKPKKRCFKVQLAQPVVANTPIDIQDSKGASVGSLIETELCNETTLGLAVLNLNYTGELSCKHGMITLVKLP